MTLGGDTKVRIRRKSTKIATMTPVLLIRSMSVIFTAFAERTRKITEILKKKNFVIINFSTSPQRVSMLPLSVLWLFEV